MSVEVDHLRELLHRICCLLLWALEIAISLHCVSGWLKVRPKWRKTPSFEGLQSISLFLVIFSPITLHMLKDIRAGKASFPTQCCGFLKVKRLLIVKRAQKWHEDQRLFLAKFNSDCSALRSRVNCYVGMINL